MTPRTKKRSAIIENQKRFFLAQPFLKELGYGSELSRRNFKQKANQKYPPKTRRLYDNKARFYLKGIGSGLHRVNSIPSMLEFANKKGYSTTRAPKPYQSTRTKRPKMGLKLKKTKKRIGSKKIKVMVKKKPKIKSLPQKNARKTKPRKRRGIKKIKVIVKKPKHKKNVGVKSPMKNKKTRMEKRLEGLSIY